MRHHVANPVKEKELKLENTYFFINYHDYELTKPIVRTVILIDCPSDKSEDKCYFFQDAESYYLEKGDISEADKKHLKKKIYRKQLQDLKSLFTLEGAVEALSYCLERNNSGRV